MDADYRVAALTLQINRGSNISDCPAWFTQMRTECGRKKRLDLSIARSWKHEANAKLVLDILPVTVEYRKVVVGNGTTTVSHSVLQHELSCVAVAFDVMCANTA